MKGRKSFIAKFVLTTTMVCFLANSVTVPMNAMAAEPEVQLVEEVQQEEADNNMVSEGTTVEYQLGEGIKREVTDVQDTPELGDLDTETILADMEKVEANYYKFPSTASYSLLNLRTNKADTTFQGGNGRYSLIVFGGVSSCWNTSNAIATLLKVADCDGIEELDLYLIDIKSNTTADILEEVGNSAAAQRIFLGSRSMDTEANRLYLACINAVGVGSYTMPLMVYVDKTGTIVDYTTGADGTLFSEVDTVLTAMGINLQKKVSTVAQRSQAEIKAFAKAHPISMLEDITYKTTPVTSGSYAPGELSAQSIQNGLNALNQVRYIAGLDANVTLNSTYNSQCQAGMLVNYVNGVLTHYPSKPAGFSGDLFLWGYEGTSHSNIYWCSVPMVNLANATIFGWMDDGDDFNIDVLGHRRWILNPKMGKTGYGAVTGSKGVFSAMYSLDSSGTGTQYGVMWPAQNMPVDYFDASMPWSFISGDEENVYAVSVTLTRVSDGKVWNFANIGADGYFNVDNSYCGQLGCVIFRPENLGSLRAGDAFDVRITGLNAGPISYRVNFFDMTAPDPAPITITKQPVNVSVTEGAVATFGVTAEGNGLTYQWKVRKDSSSAWTTPTAASAKTNTYTLTAKASMNGYQVACVVMDKNGNKLNSNVVKLTVKAAGPAITTQPTAQTVTAGQQATFKVAATGTGLTYQWKIRKDSSSAWTTPTAASAKTNIYTFTAKASLNGYQLACVITDKNGNKVNSNVVKLTVKAAAITVTTQPTAQTVTAGQKVSFKVAASGSGLTYQWKVRKDSSSAWTTPTAASAKTNTYTFTAKASLNGYQVACVITDKNGNKVNSNVVKLTVK